MFGFKTYIHPKIVLKNDSLSGTHFEFNLYNQWNCGVKLSHIVCKTFWQVLLKWICNVSVNLSLNAFFLILNGRVQKYINSGHHKNIVDPEPNQIFSERKESQDRQGKTTRQDSSEQPSVSPIKYPSNRLVIEPYVYAFVYTCRDEDVHFKIWKIPWPSKQSSFHTNKAFGLKWREQTFVFSVTTCSRTREFTLVFTPNFGVLSATADYSLSLLVFVTQVMRRIQRKLTTV